LPPSEEKILGNRKVKKKGPGGFEKREKAKVPSLSMKACGLDKRTKIRQFVPAPCCLTIALVDKKEREVRKNRTLTVEGKGGSDLRARKVGIWWGRERHLWSQ